MIIDCHQHFWKYNPQEYGWIDDRMHTIRRDFLPDDLKPELVGNGVQGCIAVQTEQTEAGTDFLLRLASENKFIKGVIGWVDLSADNAAQRLQHFSEHSKFKGIRYTVWDEDGAFLLDEKFLCGLAELHELGLIYEILVFDYQLKAAVEMVSGFPKQIFVLNHLGKPDFLEKPTQEWKNNIAALAAYPQVWCKISGMFSQPDSSRFPNDHFFPFLDVLVENFGTDRLVFGSDWPVCLVSASYSRTLQVVKDYFTSTSALTKVLSENGLLLYGI